LDRLCASSHRIQKITLDFLSGCNSTVTSDPCFGSALGPWYPAAGQDRGRSGQLVGRLTTTSKVNRASGSCCHTFPSIHAMMAIAASKTKLSGLIVGVALLGVSQASANPVQYGSNFFRTFRPRAYRGWTHRLSPHRLVIMVPPGIWQSSRHLQRIPSSRAISRYRALHLKARGSAGATPPMPVFGRQAPWPDNSFPRVKLQSMVPTSIWRYRTEQSAQRHLSKHRIFRLCRHREWTMGRRSRRCDYERL
jgi:hypothetical protein